MSIINTPNPFSSDDAFEIQRPCGGCCQGHWKMWLHHVAETENQLLQPVSIKVWAFLSGFGVWGVKCLYQEGMPLISLSAAIIRPFIFRTSWFKRGARGKVDIGTVQAAAFQPSHCPSHFATMIYVWPCNMASLGSTTGLYPAPCH